LCLVAAAAAAAATRVMHFWHDHPSVMADEASSSSQSMVLVVCCSVFVVVVDVDDDGCVPAMRYRDDAAIPAMPAMALLVNLIVTSSRFCSLFLHLHLILFPLSSFFYLP
jgi:hypothetical protein